MSVCLSVWPVGALTSESLDLETCAQIHLQNILIEFVYEGHRIKVKVTGAKIVSVCLARGWSAFGWKATLSFVYILFCLYTVSY